MSAVRDAFVSATIAVLVSRSVRAARLAVRAGGGVLPSFGQLVLVDVTVVDVMHVTVV
jgi:hypothetical protein